MKTRAVRLISILLCAVLVAGLGAALFLKDPGDGGAPETELARDTVMIEFSDGRSVRAAEYIYQALFYKLTYESYAGETVWAEDLSLGTELLYDIDRLLAELYAAETFGAEYDGFSLGAEQLQKIDDDIKALESEYGDGYLELFLERYGITEAEYREFQTRMMYRDEFCAHYIERETDISDADVDRYLAEHYLGVKNILIVNDEGDDPEENRALIGEIKEQLDGGADFDALREQYSEDRDADGKISDPDGYTFAPDSGLAPDLAGAAAEMEIGGISGVLESAAGAGGYYIIMRVPPNRESAAAAIRQTLGIEVFQAALKPYADALAARSTEARKSLTISGVRAFGA